MLHLGALVFALTERFHSYGGNGCRLQFAGEIKDQHTETTLQVEVCTSEDKASALLLYSDSATTLPKK